MQIVDYQQQQQYQTYLLQNQSPQVSAFNNLRLLASAPQPQSRSASSSPK